ncbi:DUF1499 domain-containing protein [Rhodanobacter sp. Root627]|uniref:DUF1499 domain-containing protein n=1 Tax=Rhodanobacter sp. Root627 TaxID=1736572 RepID=UPI0009E9F230|nr:DUF1499 domain-containing protein [Rhodanobacter sp. Root627]
MNTRPPFPWTRRIASLGLLAGIVALLAMLAGPLYRAGMIGLGAAFSSVFFGYWLGLLAALFGVIALLLALFAQPRRYLVRALIAIVLGVIAFVPPMLFKHKAGSVPAIHDITTDTANPPPFQTLLAERADAPNSAVYGGAEVAAKQHAAYPDIQPLQFDAPPATVFKAALDNAKSMGWAIAAQVPDEGRIEATATTFWFGFKDDVVIRLRPEAGGTRVDVRSESRVGGSDVGANAARIRAYSRKLREAVGAH